MRHAEGSLPPIGRTLRLQTQSGFTASDVQALVMRWSGHDFFNTHSCEVRYKSQPALLNPFKYALVKNSHSAQPTEKHILSDSFVFTNILEPVVGTVIFSGKADPTHLTQRGFHHSDGLRVNQHITSGHL